MAKAKAPKAKAPKAPKTNNSSSSSSSNNKKITNSLQIKNISKADQVNAGPSRDVTHTDIAPTSLAQSAQMSPLAQAEAAKLGPAAQGTASQLDLGGYNQFKGDQRGLISQLQDQASGKGPSVAEAQFKMAADRGQAQQMSMAASQRGRSGGLAGRNAMMNTAAMNQDLAGQSAIARMQEQQAAQNQLGTQINYGMNSEANIASQNAQLAQQMGMTNLGAQNQFALSQAGMQNDANLANMGAANQYSATQAGFDQQTNLANASAQNATSAQQANIWANENSANAASANDMAKYQAALTQQTNLANSGALNQGNIAQAQIYGQNSKAQIDAGAQMGAAGLQAGSSRYASDTQAKMNAMNNLVANDQAGYVNGANGNQADYNNSTK